VFELPGLQVLAFWTCGCFRHWVLRASRDSGLGAFGVGVFVISWSFALGFSGLWDWGLGNFGVDLLCPLVLLSSDYWVFGFLGLLLFWYLGSLGACASGLLGVVGLSPSGSLDFPISGISAA
jgi:hypothetical protein